MRKKTYDEYVLELKAKNPTVEIVGEYMGTNTKTTHHCLTHDIYWDTTPARVLQGCGCEMCRKEKFFQTRCKTHHQYIEEVKKVNPNIEVIEKYTGAKTQIKHYCKKHNIFWSAYPSSILKGCGCIECGKEKIGYKNSKNHEQYINELKNINGNIIVISKYMGADIPILHRCLIDGYEWYAQPSNILSGKGCPKCAKNIKKSHDEYVHEISLINSDIEVLEEYINIKTHILHRCKKHNIIWKTSPVSILQGCGCSVCAKEKLSKANRKTHEKYIEELNIINPNIRALEKYIGANTPILHKCLLDGNEWYATPGNILFGTGCPKCKVSKGGISISRYLDRHNIDYTREKRFSDCVDIRPLPFDFYLPKYNICIEYDGEQHNRSVKHFGGDKAFYTRIKHDNIKNEYCKNNGISLLRIPYFKNIEEELNNFLFI